LKLGLQQSLASGRVSLLAARAQGRGIFRELDRFLWSSERETSRRKAVASWRELGRLLCSREHETPRPKAVASARVEGVRFG